MGYNVKIGTGDMRSGAFLVNALEHLQLYSDLGITLFETRKKTSHA